MHKRICAISMLPSINLQLQIRYSGQFYRTLCIGSVLAPVEWQHRRTLIELDSVADPKT